MQSVLVVAVQCVELKVLTREQVHQLLIGSRLSNLTMPVELDESHYRASLEAFTNSSEVALIAQQFPHLLQLMRENHSLMHCWLPQMISLSSNQQADVARTLTAIGYALKMVSAPVCWWFAVWLAQGGFDANSCHAMLKLAEMLAYTALLLPIQEYIEPATGYSFDIWIPDEVKHAYSLPC